MSNEMPAAVDAYFAAKTRNDVEGMLTAFIEDAAVEDEEQTMRGKDAIRNWIVETNSKYKYTVEVIQVTQSGVDTKVRCRLTGDFPGSPVDVDYKFVLRDGKIASLTTV